MKYISFSQISKYLTCPKSYKYYYVDRLRERTATAFLAFGSAIDNALNAILIDLQQNGSVTVDYKTLFDQQWASVEINKKQLYLPTCTRVGYAKADFVEELIQPEDLAEIKYFAKDYDIPFTTLGQMQKTLEEKKSNRATFPFRKEEHALLNLMNWYSMKRKAHLMLEAFIRDIVPRIDKVISVQKKIEMKSEGGPSFIGYIDAVVLFKGDTENTILDNKTSASFYDPQKVTFSQQLSSYCYELGLNKAAYAVMLKNIDLNKTKTCTKCGHIGEGSHKTCNAEIMTVDKKGKEKKTRCQGEWDVVLNPKANTQLVTGFIKRETQEMVLDNAADVVHAIASGVFPRNLNTCQSIYGNPCPYIRKCWANKDDNLEYLPDEN